MNDLITAVSDKETTPQNGPAPTSSSSSNSSSENPAQTVNGNGNHEHAINGTNNGAFSSSNSTKDATASLLSLGKFSLMKEGLNSSSGGSLPSFLNILFPGRESTQMNEETPSATPSNATTNPSPNPTPSTNVPSASFTSAVNGHQVIPATQLETTQRQIIPSDDPSKQMYVDITEYLNMPQTTAAKKLGIPTSTLSKRWKEAVVARKWPYRTVSKIDKEIMTLLHNIPQGPDAPPLPAEIEHSLAILLRKRQEELRTVIIRV